ncbi:MAG: pseudouridine synthase [Gammaproteobacteria bacterium]
MKLKPIRIQKLLSEQNIASRRKIEEWILAGRIQINGMLAKIGDKVTLEDRILIDGKAVTLKADGPPRLIMYHKPDGEICSKAEPFHEDTVFDALPPLKQGRWVAVGRLDLNTSGLLLFTNRGELAHHLMHPKFNFERVYLARVLGKLSISEEKALLAGVQIEGGSAKFSKLQLVRANGANTWYQVGLFEGKNREVKKLFAHCNIQVNRLKRIQYGPFILPKTLKPRKCEEIPASRFKKLSEGYMIKQK